MMYNIITSICFYVRNLTTKSTKRKIGVHGLKQLETFIEERTHSFIFFSSTFFYSLFSNIYLYIGLYTDISYLQIYLHDIIKSNIVKKKNSFKFQAYSIYIFFSNHGIMISHQFVLKMLFGLGFFEVFTLDIGYFVFFKTDFGY